MKFNTKIVEPNPYGMWTVLEGPRTLCKYPGGRDRITCKCQCICGEVQEVDLKSLKSGASKSCGCSYRGGKAKTGTGRTHGMSRTPIYVTWRNMLLRCNNATDPKYPRYGGRGIKVCERWYKFENFFEDMGAKPSIKHSLERLDNNDGYYKENCRWATAKEQANNRSTTYTVTFGGEELTITELAKRTGHKQNFLWRRITQQGMSPEEAVSKPSQVNKKNQREFTHNGKTQKLLEWSKEVGIDMQVLWHRMFVNGWSFEEAISRPVSLSARERYAAVPAK